MVFETKKIAIETLGEYLYEVRTQHNLSLKEVADQTGIAEKFLEELESGQFQKLPPDVYIIGFLKKLANLYALSTPQLVEQYKKERSILEQVSRRRLLEQKGWRGLLSRLIITPKLLSLGVGVLAVLGIVVYLTASVAAIDRNPSLEIIEPTNGSIIKDGSIKVSGTTDPGNTLIINDQEVYVDAQGAFTVTLGAVAGQKVLDIKAKNKFERQTQQQILVVVESNFQNSPDTSAQAVQNNTPLLLDLTYSATTTRTITTDNGTAMTKTISKGASEQITADSKIVVETDDAGSIKVTLNGQSLGSLGRAKEHLIVPFTKDAVVSSASDMKSNNK